MLCATNVCCVQPRVSISLLLLYTFFLKTTESMFFIFLTCRRARAPLSCVAMIRTNMSSNFSYCLLFIFFHCQHTSNRKSLEYCLSSCFATSFSSSGRPPTQSAPLSSRRRVFTASIRLGVHIALHSGQLWQHILLISNYYHNSILTHS